MSKALYRKYRSKTLGEIVGQEHITGILKRAIDQDKIAHAYLLTGPRGVGKTSIARILAHEINQLPYTDEPYHLDIIEIDAASNNSVEDVRDLREKVQIAPVAAKRKVYIIDEVHMLSKQAFNALLKTLEEPPAHIVFILATTDADKLPATIISRVQRFNFRPITESDAARHLEEIAKKEGIAIEPEAIELIALHGNGSFRDSISLLDQMQHLSDGTITRDMVAGILGLAGNDIITQLLEAYLQADLTRIVALLDEAESRGTTPGIITEQLIRALRRDITTNPAYLPLLDKLIDVTKSAWPGIKLLTALSSNAVPMPQAAAPAKPQAKPPVANASAEQKPKASEPEPSLKPQPKPQKEASPPKKPKSAALTAAKPAAPFMWASFVDQAGTKISAGTLAILKSCGHELNASELIVYAGKKFNQNLLNKILPDLNATLNDLGVNASVIITATAKPPEDEATAAILDMMGGGEEVNV